MEQRIFATQAAVLGVAIFAYILAALFAERRQQSAVTEESENRLRARSPPPAGRPRLKTAL
jgi:hypothetical protein